MHMYTWSLSGIMYIWHFMRFISTVCGVSVVYIHQFYLKWWLISQARLMLMEIKRLEVIIDSGQKDTRFLSIKE